MKYFKIEEITEDEYLNATNDPYYYTPFEQSLIPVNNKVYCATVEESFEVDTSLFNKGGKNEEV